MAHDEEKLKKVAARMSSVTDAHFNVEINNNIGYGMRAQVDLRTNTVQINTAAINNLNESELAGVLAHELGHIEGNHKESIEQRAEVLKRAVTEVVQETGQKIEDSGGGFIKRTLAQIFVGGLEVAGAKAELYRLSREHEDDADSRTIELLYKAGYDPDACASALEKMGPMYVSESFIQAIYSTHPQIYERIRKISEKAAEFPKPSSPSPASPSSSQENYEEEYEEEEDEESEGDEYVGDEVELSFSFDEDYEDAEGWFAVIEDWDDYGRSAQFNLSEDSDVPNSHRERWSCKIVECTSCDDETYFFRVELDELVKEDKAAKYIGDSVQLTFYYDERYSDTDGWYAIIDNWGGGRRSAQFNLSDDSDIPNEPNELWECTIVECTSYNKKIFFFQVELNSRIRGNEYVEIRTEPNYGGDVYYEAALGKGNPGLIPLSFQLSRDRQIGTLQWQAFTHDENYRPALYIVSKASKNVPNSSHEIWACYIVGSKKFSTGRSPFQIYEVDLDYELPHEGTHVYKRMFPLFANIEKNHGIVLSFDRVYNKRKARAVWQAWSNDQGDKTTKALFVCARDSILPSSSEELWVCEITDKIPAWDEFPFPTVEVKLRYLDFEWYKN